MDDYGIQCDHPLTMGVSFFFDFTYETANLWQNNSDNMTPLFLGESTSY